MSSFNVSFKVSDSAFDRVLTFVEKGGLTRNINVGLSGQHSSFSDVGPTGDSGQKETLYEKDSENSIEDYITTFFNLAKPFVTTYFKYHVTKQELYDNITLYFIGMIFGISPDTLTPPQETSDIPDPTPPPSKETQETPTPQEELFLTLTDLLLKTNPDKNILKFMSTLLDINKCPVHDNKENSVDDLVKLTNTLLGTNVNPVMLNLISNLMSLLKLSTCPVNDNYDEELDDAMKSTLVQE